MKMNEGKKSEQHLISLSHNLADIRHVMDQAEAAAQAATSKMRSFYRAL